MGKIYYNVIVNPIEDQGEEGYCMQFTDEELEILHECTKMAKEEDISLEEILETEGYNDLLQHIYDECNIQDDDDPMWWHQVVAVDLDNPWEL